MLHEKPARPLIEESAMTMALYVRPMPSGPSSVTLENPETKALRSASDLALCESPGRGGVEWEQGSGISP
jgi:hypothetical protein